jgi:hypothetical protein
MKERKHINLVGSSSISSKGKARKKAIGRKGRKSKAASRAMRERARSSR